MKKIIKSILGGICLAIVIGLICPNAFLTPEAQWTSQSDMGRLDIGFEGNIQNGQIEAKGNKIRVDKPKWFLKKGWQGSMVHFPISYFKKSYQITLVPKGNLVNENYNLYIKFMGKDFRIDDQRKPAYVKFKNIKINGKLISAEETVCHDKAYFYYLKGLSEFKEIQLEFEIQKPIALKDIVWKNFAAFTGLFILLFCFSYFQKTRKFFKLLNKEDIVKVISESYFKIDWVYRRSFWIIFAVLCFAFGFHTIYYMWGNHDWSYASGYPLPWDGRAFEGRYALNLFKNTFFKGIYLPIVQDVFTFLLLSLNAILLCIYWKIEKRIIYFVLCGLILTAQPFTLAMLYYVHMLPETFMGVTFTLIALLLSEKISFKKFSILQKGFLALVCIVLIDLSLAMYPVIINTIAVIFVGRLFLQSLNWDGTKASFKKLFYPYKYSLLNILLGIILYKITLYFSPLNASAYNVETLSLDALPERLNVIIYDAFFSLYKYPFPFISPFVILTFGFCFCLIAGYLLLKNKWQTKVLQLLLLVGALLATKVSMIIAKQYIVDPRIELFGLIYFQVLLTGCILSYIKKQHNIAVILFSSMVFVSVINDIDCLRVWKLGFDGEKMMWNRMITRLETHTDFNPQKKYKVIQVGYWKTESMRPKYTKEKPGSMGLRDFSYNLFPFGGIQFYYLFPFVDSTWKTNIENPAYKAHLKRLYEAGILDKAKAWPHQNGLIVWNDIILYVTDESVLSDYKERLEKEFPKLKAIPEENLSGSGGDGDSHPKEK